jgi:hypothetical protein
MTIFGRWPRAITHNAFDAKNTILRKAALGVAGLAFVGGAVAGPTSAATAAPVDKPVASMQRADKPDTPDKPKPKAKDVGFQYEEQPNFYFCGPASTRIALSAHGKAPSQDELAKQLGTTTNGTNSAEEISRVLNSVTGKDIYKTVSIPGDSATAAEADKLRADIVQAIDQGRGVVANVIGSATNADGRVLSFPGGHYLTVVGYADDGQAVKIADPWQPVGDGTYWMSAKDLANWTATRGYSA